MLTVRIERMPLYSFNLAVGRQDPYPSVSKLPTIEADSPEAALERLKKAPLKGPPGVSSVWLRVVVSTHENGTVHKALVQEVP